MAKAQTLSDSFHDKNTFLWENCVFTIQSVNPLETGNYRDSAHTVIRSLTQ